MLAAGYALIEIAALGLWVAMVRRGRTSDLIGRLPYYGYIWRNGISTQWGRWAFGCSFFMMAVLAFGMFIYVLSGHR